MDKDAPVQPTTGDAKPPIELLHDDALGLVFAALVEMPVLCNQRIVMEAPLRLSHVCRRWRSLALASPKLWSRIIWSHRGNVDVAFTLLERSRSALLDVLIELPGRKEPGWWSAYASEADWEAHRDAETVFRALLPHFWRTSSLDIRFSPGTPSSSLLEPLLSPDTPFAMPHLRRIYISAMGGTLASIPPRLNIACPHLVSVSLDYLLPRSWSVLLGPETLSLDLDLQHCPIQIGELRHVLRLAPNLRFLALSSFTLFEDERPSPVQKDGNDVLCTHLDDFCMYSFSSDSIALLSTLPIHLGQNTNVKIHTGTGGTPFDLAYGYLRAEELVGITNISITNELSLVTATGSERIVNAETMPVGRLRNLFVNTPVLSTVTVLTADFEHWPELVHVLASAQAPGPASLPRLETLRLSVIYYPDPLDEEDPADAPAVPRVAVLMSALARIELALRFTKLPPEALVQRVACALAYLRAPGAVLLVDDVYRSLGDADFARCCDMLREEMRNESVPVRLLDFSLHRRGQSVSSCNACSCL